MIQMSPNLWIINFILMFTFLLIINIKFYMIFFFKITIKNKIINLNW